MSLRSAFRYARDEYTNGVPRSDSVYADQPDLTSLKTLLVSENKGSEILIVNSLVGTADFQWWAERYLAEEFGYDRTIGEFMHPPAGVDTDAAMAFDLEPSGLIRILLMNADSTTKIIDYRPTDIVRMANYVNACYQTRRTFGGNTTTETREAEPGETDSSSHHLVIVDRVGETQETTTKIVVVISGSEATVTTTVTTVVTSRPKYFIYRAGSGKYPELDSWVSSTNLESPYYPSIPLRVDNKDWTDEAHQRTELYKTSEKLLKKLGASLSDLADSVNSNEQINEIDFAFVTFGVGLKSKSPEGKKYLFKFFEHLRNISQVTHSEYTDWRTGYLANPTANVSSPKTNVLQIYSQKDRANNHDIKLQWQYIDNEIKSGQIFPGAKKGDVDISMSGTRQEFNLMVDFILDSSMLYARRQIDEDTYEELAISGLTYENFIYKGKSVLITAYDAFHDEDENGFIVPLNQGIIRDMSLVDVTDLAYQCMHMVFNCYKIVKKKWYQSTLFKIIVVIIAIVIIVVSWGTATPAATGMVGAAFTAAAALGFTLGTMAFLIAAATIYVLAAMVLMAILTKASTALFGEKWGAIIAMVISFVALNWNNLAAMAGGTATSAVTASTIINASTMVLNAYGQWTAMQMTDVQKEALGLMTEYEKQMKEIEDLTKMNLDTSLDMIDIQGYTEASWQLTYEMPDTFLSRTLLTGSDICAITSGMVDNYAEVGLQLPGTG